MNWRAVFVVIAAVCAVIVGFGFTDWDAAKVLAVGLLALAIACFPVGQA